MFKYKMNGKIKQIVIKPATQKDKKLQALITYDDNRHKTIPFGQKTASDFTKHKDETRKDKYLKRHEKDPKFIDTAGGLARDILWSKPSLDQAIKYASKKHHVYIIKA